MRQLDDNWFPGRTIGGIALIAGPILWTIALVLRLLPFENGAFTPEQVADFNAKPFGLFAELSAYEKVPTLVISAYAMFMLAVAVMLPAHITLARVVGQRHRRLAQWGALLVCLSLLARFYFAGVEQAAFQLVDDQGLDWTMKTIFANYMDLAYGPWRIAVWCSVGHYFGIALLIIAAHRGGILGTGRCLLLLPMAGMWVGVLKGGDIFTIGGCVLACVVLAPLGLRVLRNRIPAPATPRWLSW